MEVVEAQQVLRHVMLELLAGFAFVLCWVWVNRAVLAQREGESAKDLMLARVYSNYLVCAKLAMLWEFPPVLRKPHRRRLRKLGKFWFCGTSYLNF